MTPVDHAVAQMRSLPPFGKVMKGQDQRRLAGLKQLNVLMSKAVAALDKEIPDELLKEYKIA